LQVIEDLSNSLDEELIEDALKLESGIKEKCDEIKRHKMLIRKLIAPKFKVNASTQVELKTRDKATEMSWMYKNASTQADTQPSVVFQPIEKIVEVEKIVEKPVQVVKLVEVERIVEVPIEVTRIKEVEVVREVEIQVPVEVVKI